MIHHLEDEVARGRNPVAMVPLVGMAHPQPIRVLPLGNLFTEPVQGAEMSGVCRNSHTKVAVILVSSNWYSTGSKSGRSG